MKDFPVAWRWTLAVLIAVVALAVAVWPRASRDTAATGAVAPVPAPRIDESDRAAAQLARCPEPAPGVTGGGPLAGITLDCLADGRPVPLAAALAGKPALLNLWAYWCAPCRGELPDLAAYAQRAGGAVTVLTVHSDPDAAKALAMLTDLNGDLSAKGRAQVHFPGVEDPGGKVRAAIGAPNVLPVTVLLRPDGSVARTVVRPFTGVDDIAATVANDLGVAA
ncbi:TlpA family protein disulfide reductase [Nocardia arthritidis]|uniref:TlpA family protein disulfide reductase n=1 Tax=Nocardia arthritidis TaxID=228602 RepID=UPI00142D3735|nr:TlpA disulfide reductase family protein [Nocardia arthritidis]